MELIDSGIGRHQRDKRYQHEKIGIACSGFKGEVTCGAQVIRGLWHQAGEAAPPFQNRRL
jgi:hypothetical protein